MANGWRLAASSRLLGDGVAPLGRREPTLTDEMGRMYPHGANWLVLRAPIVFSRGSGALGQTGQASFVTCGTFNQAGWKALRGLRVRSGDLLDRVDALQCGSLDSTTVSNEVTVGIGGTGGGASTIACKTANVTGFFAREQDKLGGLALHCGSF